MEICKPDDLYIISEPIVLDHKITIDIKDVIDFCFCPLLYKYKKETPNELNIRELYDHEIRKTVYQFLFDLQNDKEMNSSLEFLKYLWGKYWIRSKTKKDLLITPSAYKRDTWDNKRQNGIKSIINFDEMIGRDSQFIIAVKHRYEIEIIPNVVLTGVFECIREKQNEDGTKTIQLINFVVDSNVYDTVMAQSYNLESIAAAFAFEQLFDKVEYQSITMNILTKKTYFKNFNEKDFKLLKDTVKSVIISLQNNINCTAPGQKCFHCSYRKKCEKNMK